MSSSLPAPPIARLDGVSKRYELRHGGMTTLRERLLRRSRTAESGAFWALRNVSLEVQPGETLGIVGANGSGKTTILKLLAGITASTEGRVVVGVRCGALIELGAGFHPELTGRDNVFLNGAIFGLSRAQIADRYRTIVDFAELDDFMDTPVKHYSSGMIVRLGFAIAVNVDADLLLVDEALSVGDHRFQEKSLQKVVGMQREGKSFVVVSHSLEMLKQVCHRVAWLEAGQVRTCGAPELVIDQYVAKNSWA